MQIHTLTLLPNGRWRLLDIVRWSFWFACFWAVVGTVWRPPLASVALVCIFLLLLFAFEWTSRRLSQVNKISKVEPDESIDDTVWQQIIRSKTPEGTERLEGTFWAEFPAKALTVTVHIPFCPAFERVPDVQVFSVDGTDVHMRIAPPKTYGVRIDVKRDSLTINRLCFAVIAVESKSSSG